MSEMKLKLKRLIGAYWLEILLGVFTIAITAVAICQWGWLTKGEYGNGHAIRTLVFAYGAIGAFYALILNVRRLKMNEAGLFSDRLGRGVEALANEKKLHIRAAGVRILENLYKTAEPDNQKLIRNLLLDFICNQTDIYDPAKETKPRRWKGRVDIEIAIKILGELVSAENIPLEEKQKELDMMNLDLRNLDLSSAKLEGANFGQAGLQAASFTVAKLQKARFWSAKLQGTWFVNAELQKADFASAELEKADLTAADLENVKNLTQTQLDTAIYRKNTPPKLPAELTIPENRAYKWEKDENGNMYRRIISTGEWIR